MSSRKIKEEIKMINLLFSVVVILAGLPMLINPKKITERENSKIKSEMGVRICGIIIIALGIGCFFI